MPMHQFLHSACLRRQAARQGGALVLHRRDHPRRRPGARRHPALKYPAEPTILFGISPLTPAHRPRAGGKAVDTKGRRLRRDGAVLVAAVASYPVPRADVEARDQPQERDLYIAWRTDAVAWFQGQFGATLLSIVEHVDEDYLHLHFYAVPDSRRR